MHRLRRENLLGPRATQGLGAYADGPTRLRPLDDATSVVDDKDAVLERLKCPHCGSDRLVPLTYTPFRKDEGVSRTDEPIRPMMKCVVCGKRVYARTITRRKGWL